MPTFYPGNRLIEIDYINADDEPSRRQINLRRCSRVDGYQDWYMEGFCHLRRESRTFRSDRIQTLWDIKHGGERHDDASGWVEALWQASPEAIEEAQSEAAQQAKWRAMNAERLAQDALRQSATALVDKHFHAMRVLLYVAKADKAFRQAERRLYALFFRRATADAITTDALEALCMKQVDKLDVPSTGQFHYSIRQLIGEPRPYRMAICATAKAMLNSDKKTTAYEDEVMAHLLKRLRPTEG